VVKNYPKNKPFVYNNKIIVEGNIELKEKQRFALELANYWIILLFLIATT
jgi:outer membrane protein insertion porin family